MITPSCSYVSSYLTRPPLKLFIQLSNRSKHEAKDLTKIHGK